MNPKILFPVIISATTVAANAALFVNDHFTTGGGSNYAVGTLNGQGPTNVGAVTGNWINDSNAQVSATGLTYGGANYNAASGGSVNVPAGINNGRQGRILSTAYTSSSVGTVYLSFLMQTGTDNANGYRAFELHDGGFDDTANRKFQLGFQDGDFLSGGTNYGYRLFSNDGFRSALGANNSGVNLFVAKFVFSDTNDGDVITVWQNPDLSSGEDPSGGVTRSGFNMSFDRFTVAKFGNSNVVSWDEIRFGDTFSDVTGAVPEPGVSILAGLAGGMLLIRRRR